MRRKFLHKPDIYEPSKSKLQHLKSISSSSFLSDADESHKSMDVYNKEVQAIFRYENV